MTDKHINLDIMQLLGPGGQSMPCQIPCKRAELTYETQKYMHALGPTPKRCLEALADLGLSNPEIARYLKIPKGIVKDLREVWHIDGES